MSDETNTPFTPDEIEHFKHQINSNLVLRFLATIDDACGRLAAAPVCGMCGAPAVCLSVDNEPPARAMFACGGCCGCGSCANVHDAENPYCEAETGGCWRLFAIPAYVNSLRDDLNALDETTASRISELEHQLAAANAEIERLRGDSCEHCSALLLPRQREPTLCDSCVGVCDDSCGHRFPDDSNDLDAMIDTGEVRR